MIVIGEKLNSSIPAAHQAFESGDINYIKQMAKAQLDCGADYLDVNAGLFPDEAQKLVWAISNILSEQEAGIVVDSTNPESIAYVLENVESKKIIINSITLEKPRLEGILPLVKQYHTGVIALPISSDGIPKTTEKRVENAEKLIKLLNENGIKDQDIYIDILVEAASVEWETPKNALEAARIIRSKYPNVHLVSGLSNISYGLPKRKYLNNAFLSAAISSGVDAAIMDITNVDLKMTMYAAMLISGQDEYCGEYLSAFREIFG